MAGTSPVGGHIEDALGGRANIRKKATVAMSKAKSTPNPCTGTCATKAAAARDKKRKKK